MMFTEAGQSNNHYSVKENREVFTEALSCGHGSMDVRNRKIIAVIAPQKENPSPQPGVTVMWL